MGLEGRLKGEGEDGRGGGTGDEGSKGGVASPTKGSRRGFADPEATP